MATFYTLDVNNETIVPVFSYDLCTFRSDLYPGDHYDSNEYGVPVSLHDAGECIPEPEFGKPATELEWFKNKMAVWMYTREQIASCNNDYWTDIENVYKTAVEAGSLGVFLLEQLAGSVPGFYTTTGTIDSNYTSEIPFLWCGISDHGRQAELEAFSEKFFYNAEVEGGANPFPNGLFVNITGPFDNPWTNMFNSGFYQPLFRGFFPVCFVLLAFQAFYYLFVRRKTLDCVGYMQVMTVVLVAECFICSIFSVYLFLDGQFSVRPSPFPVLGELVLDGLLFLNRGQDILVGIKFVQYRREAASTTATPARNFTEEYQLTLIFIVAGLAFMQTQAPTWRQDGTTVLLMNGLSLVLVAIIVTWFGVESQRFVHALNGGFVTKHLGIVAFTKHAIRWTRILSVALFVNVLPGFAFIFAEHTYWQPAFYQLYQLLVWITRIFISMARIQIMKPMSKMRNNSVTASGGTVRPVDNRPRNED